MQKIKCKKCIELKQTPQFFTKLDDGLLTKCAYVGPTHDKFGRKLQKKVKYTYKCSFAHTFTVYENEDIS